MLTQSQVDDIAWLESERSRARMALGSRAELLESTVAEIARETVYPFRFWWPRIMRRMLDGEYAHKAKEAELKLMREVHARGQRLA